MPYIGGVMNNVTSMDANQQMWATSNEHQTQILLALGVKIGGKNDGLLMFWKVLCKIFMK